MNTTEQLPDQSQVFASQLTELLNATVADGTSLVASRVDSRDFLIALSAVGSRKTNFDYIPLVASPKINGSPAFGLKIRYLVRFDESERRLIVEKSWTSIFALHDKPMPVLRWEYVRDGGIEPGIKSKRKHVRHAAHVQIHGWSTELNRIANLADKRPKKTISGNLDNLHFPVGGRRFRPSIEDILEFLVSHSFVSQFHDGGEKFLSESREQWLKLQLKAAISDDIDTAISTLTENGYQVQKVSES
jgi:hypothetical protein